MSRNSRSATEFFQIPPNRVVELGAQIEFSRIAARRTDLLDVTPVFLGWPSGFIAGVRIHRANVHGHSLARFFAFVRFLVKSPLRSSLSLASRKLR